jgi:hypothetical protein
MILREEGSFFPRRGGLVPDSNMMFNFLRTMRLCFGFTGLHATTLGTTSALRGYSSTDFPLPETLLEAKEFTFRALGLPKWARSFPGARQALP